MTLITLQEYLNVGISVHCSSTFNLLFFFWMFSGVHVFIDIFTNTRHKNAKDNEAIEEWINNQFGREESQRSTKFLAPAEHKQKEILQQWSSKKKYLESCTVLTKRTENINKQNYIRKGKLHNELRYGQI